MKERVIQGVKIACESWLDGSMDFEAAVKFLRSYADDPAIGTAIARAGVNYFRATRDLVKTQAAVMTMRQIEFFRLQAKKKEDEIARLTRTDIPGFLESDR